MNIIIIMRSKDSLFSLDTAILHFSSINGPDRWKKKTFIPFTVSRFVDLYNLYTCTPMKNLSNM